MTQIAKIKPYPMPDADSLPDNTVEWVVDSDRAVLLVHDMQNYFLRPFDAGSPPLVDLLRNTARLRRRCDELSVPVAYTAQPGGMTDEQRGLLKDFWGPGMTAGPADRGVIGELAPGECHRVLTKWRYSAFARSSLLEHMRALGRDQLVCCGVYAHIGILSTMLDALAWDIEAFLVADAVGDFSLEDHRLAMDYAARRCGVVTTTRALLEQLGAAR